MEGNVRRRANQDLWKSESETKSLNVLFIYYLLALCRWYAEFRFVGMLWCPSCAMFRWSKRDISQLFLKSRRDRCIYFRTNTVEKYMNISLPHLCAKLKESLDSLDNSEFKNGPHINGMFETSIHTEDGDTHWFARWLHVERYHHWSKDKQYKIYHRNY